MAPTHIFSASTAAGYFSHSLFSTFTLLIYSLVTFRIIIQSYGLDGSLHVPLCGRDARFDEPGFRSRL